MSSGAGIRWVREGIRGRFQCRLKLVKFRRETPARAAGEFRKMGIRDRFAAKRAGAGGCYGYQRFVGGVGGRWGGGAVAGCGRRDGACLERLAQVGVNRQRTGGGLAMGDAPHR